MSRRLVSKVVKLLCYELDEVIRGSEASSETRKNRQRSVYEVIMYMIVVVLELNDC